MEHKMITAPYQQATKEINELLASGWMVVPGTVVMKLDKQMTGKLILTATVESPC